MRVDLLQHLGQAGGRLHATDVEAGRIMLILLVLPVVEFGAESDSEPQATIREAIRSMATSRGQWQ